jgi:thiamine-phosphate pyrophosphorylase
MKASGVKGLYAVTPDTEDSDNLLKLVEAGLQGGISLLQYRNKQANVQLRESQAVSLLVLCQRYDVPLIINDHLDLCFQIDADGVHLGGEDYEAGQLASIKTKLGNKLLGVSCYNRLDLAKSAETQGADYVAFGSCFDSGTKPAAVRAPLELLSQARDELQIPIVAIGGITLENAELAISAGVDAIAVINALFSAKEVKYAAQQFSNLFSGQTHDFS